MKSFEEIEEIVKQISFRDWRFSITHYFNRGILLVAEFNAPCAVTLEPGVQRSRKWPISPHMTKGEIVQTALLAVRVAVEHEMREDFKWRGQAIFGPHFDIELLHELCAVNGTEYRPEPEEAP